MIPSLLKRKKKDLFNPYQHQQKKIDRNTHFKKKNVKQNQIKVSVVPLFTATEITASKNPISPKNRNI